LVVAGSLSVFEGLNSLFAQFISLFFRYISLFGRVGNLLAGLADINHLDKAFGPPDRAKSTLSLYFPIVQGRIIATVIAELTRR
jgi:hypothetical protein